MTTTGLSRRRALTGAATVGLSLPLLAACGDDATDTTTTDTTGTGTGASTPTPSPTPDAEATTEPSEESAEGAAGIAASDVPVGGGVVVADAQAVVTQPTAGEFLAFSAICTHQGCLVSDVTDTINCLCHNSTFAIDSGEATSGPASAPLPPMTVTVEGDRVVLS